jgi:hypothetical protein
MGGLRFHPDRDEIVPKPSAAAGRAAPRPSSYPDRDEFGLPARRGATPDAMKRAYTALVRSRGAALAR